jgi:hypothetical protein
MFFSLYLFFPVCPVETALRKLTNPGKDKLLKYPTSAPGVSCNLWMLAAGRTFGVLACMLSGCLAFGAFADAHHNTYFAWEEAYGAVGLIVVFLPVSIISWKYRPKASCVTTADRYHSSCVKVVYVVFVLTRACAGCRPEMTQIVANHLGLQPKPSSAAAGVNDALLSSIP